MTAPYHRRVVETEYCETCGSLPREPCIDMRRVLSHGTSLTKHPHRYRP